MAVTHQRGFSKQKFAELIDVLMEQVMYFENQYDNQS